jgi:hypothetical protein
MTFKFLFKTKLNNPVSPQSSIKLTSALYCNNNLIVSILLGEFIQ